MLAPIAHSFLRWPSFCHRGLHWSPRLLSQRRPFTFRAWMATQPPPRASNRLSPLASFFRREDNRPRLRCRWSAPPRPCQDARRCVGRLLGRLLYALKCPCHPLSPIAVSFSTISLFQMDNGQWLRSFARGLCGPDIKGVFIGDSEMRLKCAAVSTPHILHLHVYFRILSIDLPLRRQNFVFIPHNYLFTDIIVRRREYAMPVTRYTRSKMRATGQPLTEGPEKNNPARPPPKPRPSAP